MAKSLYSILKDKSGKTKKVVVEGVKKVLYKKEGTLSKYVLMKGRYMKLTKYKNMKMKTKTKSKSTKKNKLLKKDKIKKEKAKEKEKLKKKKAKEKEKLKKEKEKLKTKSKKKTGGKEQRNANIPQQPQYYNPPPLPYHVPAQQPPPTPQQQQQYQQQLQGLNPQQISALRDLRRTESSGSDSD